MSFSVIWEKVKENPILLICGVLLILLTGFYFLRGSKASLLEAEVNRLQSELRTATTDIKREKGLAEDIQGLEELQKRLDQSLMRRSEKGINLDYFYGFEDDFDIHIMSVDQERAPVKSAKPVPGMPKLKTHDSIGVDINVSGPYSELLRFIYVLNNDRYLVRVDAFSLNHIEEPSEQVSLNLSLNVLGEKEDTI